MQLEFIRTATCPHCRSVPISESVEVGSDGKIKEHCHGGKWEHRKFACGHAIAYSPNFRREETKQTCPHEPSLVVEKTREKKAYDDVVAFIGTLNASDKQKQVLISSLPSWHYR